MSFASCRPLLTPMFESRFTISASMSEIGKPVSANDDGSLGRNDSSAMIVANRLLLKLELEIVSAMILIGKNGLVLSIET